MRTVLLHWLLSFALVIQGVGAACASVPATSALSGMSGMSGMAGKQPTALVAHSQRSSAGASGCEHCPGCPDGAKPGADCMPGCGMAATLPEIQLLSHAPMAIRAVVATRPAPLETFRQAPPTPPPIA